MSMSDETKDALIMGAAVVGAVAFVGFVVYATVTNPPAGERLAQHTATFIKAAHEAGVLGRAMDIAAVL